MIEAGAAGWETWLNKYFIPLVTAAIVVNVGALAVPILEPDGALYATIAKTIARSGNFTDLMVEGQDWLDKPHFPFWLAAFSMRIFGVNGFAYKLPALIFWAAGAWYTYRFAFRLYGRSVARLAVLIYVSAAHLVISNNDVRAEPYLTGLVIGSVYHFYLASGKKDWVFDCLMGALLAACAMMTKGLFVLVTIGGGFIFDWIARGRWQEFLRPRWWIALLLALLFTLPELYCLYRQFDLHPEKIVFGKQQVSGLKFFFWDSQFGRFFNNGPIRGQGDIFFYFHTILWAFLPWSLLLYAAIYQKGRTIRRSSHQPELICLGAALISFCMFSLSKFQLPHYLNILFPFFSILTAEWLFQVKLKPSRKAIFITQHIIALILPLLLLVLSAFFRFSGWPVVMILTLLFSIAIFFLFRTGGIDRAFGRSYCMALLAYAFVNFIFYPAILQYQAGWRAGQTVTASNNEFPNGAGILAEAPANYSFEFYAPGDVRRVSMDTISAGIFFMPVTYTDSLRLKGHTVESLQLFSNFHISQLSGPFINRETRNKTLETWILAKVR